MSKNKDKPSKKAVREKKERTIEDATFGLKNKNKSKKVQQFVHRVEKAVANQSGDANAAKAKEAKKSAKLVKQLQEEELRVLFNEGISGQFGKKKSKANSAAEELGLTEANKTVSEFLENLSSDSEDDDDDEYRGNGEIFLPDEPQATEIFREKTIEDIIEEQRAKLAAEGKKGTPVTEATFQMWQIAKRKRKQEEAEARLKAEQAKKKGGKGLGVLSGKELFNFNSSLFVDDDAAIDSKDENALSAETKKLEELEELRMQEEMQRVQAEQERLAELQRIEFEVRLRKEEDRRLTAKAADRTTFMLNGVEVNEIVFEEDEEEDLSFFPEENLVEVPLVKVADAVMEDDGEEDGEDMDGGDGSDGDDDDDDDDDRDDEEGQTGEEMDLKS